MKIKSMSILIAILIVSGMFVGVPTYKGSAQKYCDALPDKPYLDDIHRHVVVGGGWYCSGGYSSEVHIGIKVLAKRTAGSPYTIIDMDSYWIHDQSKGSYFSSVPVADDDMWYQIQITVDGNLGYGFGTATSWLEAGPKALWPSPVRIPLPR